LSKVDLVNETIKGLRDGNVSLEQADKVHNKINKKEIRKQREQETRRREKRLEKNREEKVWEQGRPGKGVAKDYEKFCEGCMLEFKKDKDVCTQCNKDLVDREARTAKLCDKVNILLQAQHQRKWRRERFKHWTHTRTKDAGTDYNTWDYWEPDSDSDSDVPTPDTPEFKAMEADIDKRNAIRAEKARKSQICKEQGNNAVSFKNYKDAVGFYGQAIQHRKDDKFLYTNRALVYLYLNKYKSAEKDLNTALDIWEFLEDGKEKLRRDEHRKFAIKAYLRRAAALRGLKKFDKALEDLDELLAFDPTNKECLKHKVQALKDLEEEKKAAEILSETKEAKESKQEETESSGGADAAAAATEPVAAEPAKPTVDLTSGTPFEQITACLSVLRDFNEGVANTFEEMEDWDLLEPEEMEGKEKPSPPSVSEDARQALGALHGLVKESATNEQNEKNSIFLREKKGVVTLIKLLRVCLKLVEHDGTATALFSEVCKTLLEACENEHSREAFVRSQGLGVLVEALTTLEQEQANVHAKTSLKLFSFACEHPAARAVIHRDFTKIWSIIVKYGLEADRTPAADGEVGPHIQALNLLCNCSFDSKFRKEMREAKPKPLSLMVPLLQKLSLVKTKAQTPDDLQTTGRIWGALANALSDQHMRREFAKDDSNLKAVCKALRPYCSWYKRMATGKKNMPPMICSIFKKMLALTLNCAVESEKIIEILFATNASQLIGDLTFVVMNPNLEACLRDRCSGLLSRASALSEHQAAIIAAGGCEAFLVMLGVTVEVKGLGEATSAAEHDQDDEKMMETAHERATRALALLTNHEKACDKVFKYKGTKESSLSGRQLLLQSLASKNPQVSGNAALVVGHIALKISDSIPVFKDTIPFLIELMKIEKPASLSKNAAIATARLARHPENIKIVRQLRGIELMHAVGRRK